MAIPAFVNCLLPIVGPGGVLTQMHDRTPFEATLAEFAQRFRWNRERRDIIRGLLSYRAELRRLGVVGVQWLAGSFVEEKEKGPRGCAPNDIDVVSVVAMPDGTTPSPAVRAQIAALKRKAKSEFHCDAFTIIPRAEHAELAYYTHYWVTLFGHSRDYDGAHRGIVSVPLGPGADPSSEALLGPEIEQ